MLASIVAPGQYVRPRMRLLGLRGRRLARLALPSRLVVAIEQDFPAVSACSFAIWQPVMHRRRSAMRLIALHDNFVASDAHVSTAIAHKPDATILAVFGDPIPG